MSDPRDDGIDQGWFADGLTARADESVDEAPERPEQIDPTRWQRLLAAIETYRREISASVDPRRRAALCFEVGRIYEQELGDDKQAVRAYQKAFAADPTHVPTLRASRRVFGLVRPVYQPSGGVPAALWIAVIARMMCSRSTSSGTYW